MLKLTIFLALLIGAFCDSNKSATSYGFIAPGSASFGRGLIISGGYDGISDHGQVWDFPIFEDTNDWVDSASEFPDMFTSRSHQTSNVFKDYLFTFGGNSSELELQQLKSGDEHIFYQGNGPHARTGHSATIRDQELYIYGGYDVYHGKYSNHLWKAILADGTIEWQLIDMDSPAGARAGHTAILYQESLYIFGGQDQSGAFFNDVWRFDFITGLWIRSWVWDQVSIHPAGRVGHVGTYWNDETYVIFGGFGAEGFLNDMWSFNLQGGFWTRLFQGQEAGFNTTTATVPSPRAYMASTVLDGKLFIVGGQIATAGVSQVFWSPLLDPRFVTVRQADDFAGDAWSYDFSTRSWTFIKCLDAFGNGGAVDPSKCSTSNQITCLNDCSGNGVCIAQDQCLCRGEWSGADCSTNPCAEEPFLGYDLDTLDRILISESILELGQRLNALKTKIQHIQANLPEFDDFVTVVRSNPSIAVLVNSSTTSQDGVEFNNNMEAEVIPVVLEFNEILQATQESDEQELVFGSK